MILCARGRQITTERHGQKDAAGGDIFKILDSLLREHTPGIFPAASVYCGAVGFFATMQSVKSKVPVAGQRPICKMPTATLMFFDRLLAFDLVRHEIFIIATADVRRQSPRRHMRWRCAI